MDGGSPDLPALGPKLIYPSPSLYIPFPSVPKTKSSCRKPSTFFSFCVYCSSLGILHCWPSSLFLCYFSPKFYFQFRLRSSACLCLIHPPSGLPSPRPPPRFRYAVGHDGISHCQNFSLCAFPTAVPLQKFVTRSYSADDLDAMEFVEWVAVLYYFLFFLPSVLR